MEGDTNLKWMLNFPDQFHWASWSDADSVVLFHEGSGDTVLLSPLGEYVLKQLEQLPLSHTELVSAVGGFFNIEEDLDLVNSIESTLRSFRKMGLIVSVKQ